MAKKSVKERREKMREKRRVKKDLVERSKHRENYEMEHFKYRRQNKKIKEITYVWEVLIV